MARDDDAYFGVDQYLDDPQSQPDAQRRRTAEPVETTKSSRTTVQAKDKSFSIVFNGPGEIVDITFHGTKYRNAAPAELGHMLVDTLRRGRIECLEKMSESMSGSPLAGLDVVGIATGRVDASKAIGAALAPLFESPLPGPNSGGGFRR